ncbi:MAG: hypothetical protein AB1585_06590 [Thermodesulfobacteriota bacterium]
MKKYLLLVVFVLMLISGCTSHYQRVKGDGVHLYLKKSDAQKVFFASSIDGFSLHPVKRVFNGIWEITVPTQGEFKYFYVVDGMPFVPACRFNENDGFGSKNCLHLPGW